MPKNTQAGRRDRLGKGLGALLGEYLETDGEAAGEVREISVGAITPNPFQPRREFADDELRDLSASIEENGLLQPVVVRPAAADADARWELVAGERRWRAVVRLGWETVPALVRELDDRALLVVALVENLQRAELSPLEEAEGYRQLADDFGLSQKEIARAIGRDRSTVSNLLRLLQLPSSIRGLVSEGKLSAGHARALLGAPDQRRMTELAEEAVKQGWSVRQVESRVKRLRSGASGRSRGERTRSRDDPTAKRLERALQRALGTEVRIRQRRGGKGRIEIPFYDAEDFERVYELLTGDDAGEVVS